MPWIWNPFTNNLDFYVNGGSPPLQIGDFVTYASPVIDFKTIGLTNFFTSDSLGTFFPITLLRYCVLATSSNGDSNINIGWTPTNYNDFISGEGFNPTVTGQILINNSYQVPIPPSTAIKINVTAGDTGTALTGQYIISGYYQ